MSDFMTVVTSCILNPFLKRDVAWCCVIFGVDGLPHIDVSITSVAATAIIAVVVVVIAALLLCLQRLRRTVNPHHCLRCRLCMLHCTTKVKSVYRLLSRPLSLLLQIELFVIQEWLHNGIPRETI
jgi:NAD-dependent dihydropyrimidine dehydrogenase PreA subunit